MMGHDELIAWARKAADEAAAKDAGLIGARWDWVTFAIVGAYFVGANDALKDELARAVSQADGQA